MPTFARLLQAGLRLDLIAGVFLTLFLLDPLAVQGFREPKTVAMLFLAGTAGLTVVGLGLHCFRTRDQLFSLPGSLLSFLPFIGLLTVQLFRTPSGGFGQTRELANQYSLYVLTPVAAWLMLMVCASSAFRTASARRALATSIMAALVGEVTVVLLEIIQNQTDLRLNPISFTGEINLMGQEIREQIYGTIGNPNFVAGYLAIAFFPVLGWTLSASRWMSGSLGVLVLSATLLAVLATRSKGAILALAAGGIHFLFLAWRYRRRVADPGHYRTESRHRLRGPLILLAIVVLLMGWILADQSAGPEEGTYLHHWLETVSLKGDSIAVRALLAECGFRMWEQHPWTGLGAGQFKIQFVETLRTMLLGEDSGLFAGRVARLQSLRANHLHNEYLQVLVEWGAVGLAAVLLFLAWCQVAAVTALNRTLCRRDRWVRLGLLSGFWAALGGCLFDLPFHRPSQVYLLALLLGGSLAACRPAEAVKRSGGRTVSLLMVLLFLPLSVWFLVVTATRYVSLREVFLAKSVLEGRIAGGDSGKAAEAIQRAIRRVPGEGENYYYLAHVLLHSRKDPNAAIVTVRRAHLLSDEPDLYLLEARAHIEKGNFSAAEPLLIFMKTLDRDRPGLHYLLGRVYQGSKRFDLARAELLTDIHCSEADPANPNPDLEDSILRLATLYEESGDFTPAVVYFEKFLARKGGQTPNYPLAQLSLARIFRDHLFDLDQAQKYLREALTVFQKNGNVEEARRIEAELGTISRQPMGGAGAGFSR